MSRSFLVRIRFFVAAFAFFSATIAGAAPPDLAAATAEGHRLAAALHEASGVPALSVAVGVGGRIAWSEGFGVANLETPSPVTAETRFRCASVSKVITVAALARLAARGVVDLDAPIQTYLPSYPATPKPITLRLLSGHLGGVRHYLPKDFLLPSKRYPNLAEALPIFSGDPLVAPPGERYNYSTFGYTLLGAALEAATGKAFLELIEEEVAVPLDLRHTGGDLRPDVLPGRAGIYDRESDGIVRHPEPDEDLSYKWPGGGLLSTPEDLVRFGFAHLSGDYFAPAVRAPLFVSQKTAAGEETGVGLGWRIGQDWRGRRIYHHSGSQAGARSTLVLYPEEGVVVAVMTNLGNSLSGIEVTAQMLAEPFLGAPAGATTVTLPTTPRAYQGKFRDGAVAGVLLLERAGTAGYRGAISVPESLGTALRSQGFPLGSTFPLVTSFPDGEGIAAVAATPFGLLPLRLVPTEKGARGTMTMGSQKLEIEIAGQ